MQDCAPETDLRPSCIASAAVMLFAFPLHQTYRSSRLMHASREHQDKVSPGMQIREALSRFDINKDGTTTKVELRKALNGLGFSMDDAMASQLMHCYDKEGQGSIEFCKFVEDIDESAFNFVFSAGMCAKSGSVERVEKEALASPLDPPEQIRNTVRVCS